VVAARLERSLRARVRAPLEARGIRYRKSRGRVVVDGNKRTGVAAGVVGHFPYRAQLPQLALCLKIHSAHDRLPAFAGCRCSGAALQLDFSGRNNFHAPLVRHRACHHRSGRRRETGGALGGTIVSLFSFILILIALVSFVAGQLLLKRAMESTGQSGFRNARFIFLLSAGILSMTVSFFITLGLLQHFDLSYLYPFQGLSVIIISLMAAVILKEKLTMQLTIGALLITAGVVLVSLS